MNAFLIDMDGTIVDSHLVVESSWTAFAERHGLDPAEVIEYCHGRPAIATTRHYLGDGPEADQAAADMATLEEGISEEIVEIVGARDFISSIPDGQWALVTSAGRELATRRLTLVGIPLPELMICSEDITHGKPHPEPFLLGAERLGVDPTDCTVLEDSDSGVRAGLAAGCRVVVVGSMETFDGQLRRVTDLADVTASLIQEG